MRHRCVRQVAQCRRAVPDGGASPTVFIRVEAVPLAPSPGHPQTATTTLSHLRTSRRVAWNRPSVPHRPAAGADLSGLSGLGGRDDAKLIAQIGHGVFRKLVDGGKPSFGFVNGLALGGGLEVALNCTYRTVQDSAPAVGLPEVMLGLVPGWGGAYLVPNLVGAEKAVKLIVENPLNQGRTLTGHAAPDAAPPGRDAGEDAKLHLFGQLKRITKEWLDSYLECKGDTYPAQLMYRQLADMACEKITRGITAQFNTRPEDPAQRLRGFPVA